MKNKFTKCLLSHHFNTVYLLFEMSIAWESVIYQVNLKLKL
jgi:hypothetical protein